MADLLTECASFFRSVLPSAHVYTINNVCFRLSTRKEARVHAKSLKPRLHYTLDISRLEVCVFHERVALFVIPCMLYFRDSTG